MKPEGTMEDLKSYHARMRAARMRSKGVVLGIETIEGELLISFPKHDGLFTLPPRRKDLLARLVESRDRQVEIAFTFDGELMIVSID